MTEQNLENVRAEIDRIDDNIHTLLMKRTSLIEEVTKAKGRGVSAVFRPVREQAILKRLFARHIGDFPKGALIRIFREIVGASLYLQGGFSVCVCMTERGAGYLELARGHFGSCAEMKSVETPLQVLRAVSSGEASVGVVPLIGEQETAENPWWPAVLYEQMTSVQSVSRLPLGGADASKGGGKEALVLSAQSPEGDLPTDASILLAETNREISRSALVSMLEGAGFVDLQILEVAPAQNGHSAYAFSCKGAVSSNDPRLAAVMEKDETPFDRLVSFGGYPIFE